MMFGSLSSSPSQSNAPLSPTRPSVSITRFAPVVLRHEWGSRKRAGRRPCAGTELLLQGTLQVVLKNDVAGDEVVQLYIHQKAGSASRPVRELKGFKRISPTPGEKQ